MQPIIRKIDCLRLYVPDLDAGIAFYTKQLGHSLVWRTDHAAGLRLPDDNTELVLQTRRQEKEIDVLVDSVDEAVACIKEAGGKVNLTPFDLQDGGRCAVVEDPWGNKFVFLEARRTNEL